MGCLRFLTVSLLVLGTATAWGGDRHRKTALLSAAKKGDKAQVEHLLNEHQVDVNMKGRA